MLPNTCQCFDHIAAKGAKQFPELFSEEASCKCMQAYLPTTNIIFDMVQAAEKQILLMKSLHHPRGKGACQRNSVFAVSPS
jgi:hypothetical protein